MSRSYVTLGEKININGAALEKSIYDAGLTKQKVSLGIGAGCDYIAVCVRSNQIAKRALIAINEKYDFSVLDAMINDTTLKAENFSSEQRFVKIDAKKTKAIIKKKKLTAARISRALGMHENYLTVCIQRGRMRCLFFNAFCKTYDINPDDIISKPAIPEEFTENVSKAIDQNGLHIDLQINDNKLKLTLLNNSEEMYHANAIMQGDDDVALTKAINSATFMIYKLAEQKQMEE